MNTKLAEYKRLLRNDPESFVEGVASFCKSAQYNDDRSVFRKILPWLIALGGGYAALKAGSAWGRYANATDNPNGPIKGPIGKLLELSLPKGDTVVWPGQKEYDDIIKLRTLQDDASWNKEFGNSVANGTAKSLTMRTRG